MKKHVGGGPRKIRNLKRSVVRLSSGATGTVKVSFCWPVGLEKGTQAGLWQGWGSRQHLKGWGAAWGNQGGGLTAAEAVALGKIWATGELAQMVAGLPGAQGAAASRCERGGMGVGGSFLA